MAAVPTIGRPSGIEPRPTAPEADVTRTLYERYSRQILNYCVHQLNSREEAEDAVQTTFMNAFRGLKRGIVPEAEQAWLFKIAENVCLSRRRSSWRRGKVESPNDFEVLQEIVPTRHGNRTDELIGLEDALEAMPENQRRAILLREWQGLSYREIADELELSQSAVETLVFRARRTLAAGLESPAAPKKRRRITAAVDGLSIGSLIASLKSVLTGGAAIHAVAAAVAAGSATVAVTQAEPSLVHHFRFSAATPARVVPLTKQSQATFRPQATVVARSSGRSVPQAYAKDDHGATLRSAVASRHSNQARSVHVPVTDAKLAHALPGVTQAPVTPVVVAPAAAATPPEQPKTEQPKTEEPKTMKGGNGNGSHDRSNDKRSDKSKTDPPRAASVAAATTPAIVVATTPQTPVVPTTPAVPAQVDGNNNGKSRGKGSDNRKQTAAATPPATTITVSPAAPAPTRTLTPPPPSAQPATQPTNGNGNGGDKGKRTRT